MEKLNLQTVDMVNLKINNIPCRAPAGSTILEAAHAAGIAIPTLCYLKGVNEIGACRMCVVEVKGTKNLVTACVYPIAEGMEVFTNTKRVQAARRTNLKLLLSIHAQECLSCPRSGECELQRLCREYGVDNNMAFEGEKNHYEIDASTPHLIRNNSKCILCRRCVATCEKVMGVSAIAISQRGFQTHVGSSFDVPLGQSACINCGQCIVACPTGAITTVVETDEVWAAIDNPQKHVIIQTAPSVRATLGESFGMPVGTNVEGKMAAALRRLGFDGVYDTDCLIIIGVELIMMITSYSLDSVVDVMLLAVSRQMIVEHTAPLENLLTVISVGLLFLIRKYLYISKIDKRAQSGKESESNLSAKDK